VSTPQDDDDARALLGELQAALGGEPDMTATSGLGPRDRDRGRDDDGGDIGDIVGGKGGGRTTRQPTTAGGGGAAPATAGGGGGGGGGGGSRALAPILLALLVGLLLGGLASAAFLGGGDDDGDDGSAFAAAIDDTRYQAVILSNDKVYFGKLESISEDFFRLDSAFFLRETRDDADAEPVRALLPVNREIHAPDNTMLIRKDEVVLVENLAKDSPILTEIKRQKG
jgi:hypothetical protein